MNGNDLLSELTNLDDDLVEKHEKGQKKSRPPWLKWGALAAALVIIVGCGVWMNTERAADEGEEQGELLFNQSMSDYGSAGEATISSSEEMDKTEEKGSGSLKNMLVSQANLPELPLQPSETELLEETDEDVYEDLAAQNAEYWEALEEFRGKSPDKEYLSNLERFFTATTGEILGSSDEKENIVYSPANLYMAMAMLTELSDGNTRQQLFDLIGTDDMDELRKQTNRIWRRLYDQDETRQTILANSLWLNENISFKQDTLDLLADKYFASTYQAEMGNADTDSAIAQWINENTGNLLRDASNKIQTNPSDIARLYSTLYFYDQWLDRFYEEANTKDTFTQSDGTEQEVDFMHQTVTGNYIRGDNYTIAAKEFAGNSKMIFVLPDEGTSVKELLSDKDNLANWMSIMDTRIADDTEESADEDDKLQCYAAPSFGQIEWSMPKFDIASNKNLNDTLETLGVTDVFGGNADLSNLTNNEAVVSEINQAARVKIDEKGCEAASYTEIAICGSAMMEDQEEICKMNLNRPFLFIITGEENLPLFVGVVNQPNA